MLFSQGLIQSLLQPGLGFGLGPRSFHFVSTSVIHGLFEINNLLMSSHPGFSLEAQPRRNKLKTSWLFLFQVEQSTLCFRMGSNCRRGIFQHFFDLVTKDV